MRRLMSELQAEGYEVYLEPTTSILPTFLHNFRPDAIAIKGDKKLIIEVVTSQTAQQKKTRVLANLVSLHPDWELRIIPISTAESLQAQSAERIERVINEVRELHQSGHVSAALILAWATFEAIARRLVPGTFDKPQTPGRIVNILAQEGYVGPADADRLRSLAKSRNALVHGNFQVEASMADIEFFLQVLERLTAEGSVT
jgi:uncharacterized protein YutE (UPF0331/DUF86 family)